MSASWFRRTVLFPLRTQFAYLLNFTQLVSADNGEETMGAKEALTVLRRIYAEQAGEDTNEVKMTDEFLSNWRDGDDIHEAMEEWFHPDICLTYRASTEAGAGVAGVNHIIDVMREQNAQKRRFFISMVVPFALMSVGLTMFTFVSTSVIPSFFSSPSDLAKAGIFVHAVMACGDILVKVLPLVLLLSPVIIAVLVYFMPRKGLFSVYRNFAAGRFFALFSLLIQSNVSIREALQLLIAHVPPFLQEHLDEMLFKTQHGVTEFQQLDTGLLPVELRIRLQVSGEKGGGSSSEIFNVIAQNATKDFGNAIERASAVAKWSMMLSGIGLLFVGLGSIFSMAFDMLMAA